MEEIMTDRQMEFIVNLVTEQFENCKNMDDVKKTIKYVREMATGDKTKNKKDV